MERFVSYFDGGYLAEVFAYYRQAGVEKTLDDVMLNVHKRLEEAVKATLQDGGCKFFRGRFAAKTSSEAGRLSEERHFEEAFVKRGAILHYFPVDERGDRPRERGIDVWLALVALEDAIRQGSATHVVLFVCDTDYLPLVRMLKRRGHHVTIIAWNFSYTLNLPDRSITKETRVSKLLLDEASLVINMG